MEPAEPVTLPCSQAKLGRGVRASAGHSWAPLPPLPTPGGVFIPPLSSAAPGVASPFVIDPRLALQPTVGASGWSSAAFQLPQFPSAPLGTPRVSESEGSDSEGSSASAAHDSAAAQLAELVYVFCPEAQPVSDSARPPRCGFESWFDPSPTLSSSRPYYAFTLGLRRWSPRCPIAQLRSTGAPSLCRQCYLGRSAGMRLRISRILRPHNQ